MALPKCMETQESRGRYQGASLRASIAFQLFMLRQQRELTQEALADICGMNQSEIARLEDMNGPWMTLDTLMKVAKGLDCALFTRFVSWGQFVSETGGLVENEFLDDSNPA